MKSIWEFSMKKFNHSLENLVRFEKSIPLGSQTFSKSKLQYPAGVSPLYLDKPINSAEVIDVDGNVYIDFVSSLASITLGYQDEDVQNAVQKQLLETGPILTLPNKLEVEVAELLIEMIPCAEMVRFGKNGSDATAGAVRLARAVTGRSIVAVCGYHGWQDWYIGSTSMNLGVPQEVRNLSKKFIFNNIDSLKNLFIEYPQKIAAVILEPMNTDYPAPAFLEEVRDLCTQNETILIFDETVTGFRFSNGGAQELFGVYPDLACFGKGIANGYPISALVGRRELMKFAEDIFFSFTFGGELISLAAAKATLIKLKNNEILNSIHKMGEYFLEAMNKLIHQEKISHLISISGHPSWLFLKFNISDELLLYKAKTYILQELHQRGILCLGSHNLTYAHTKNHIDQLINAYSVILPKMVMLLNSKDNFDSFLKVPPLAPLFKIR